MGVMLLCLHANWLSLCLTGGLWLVYVCEMCPHKINCISIMHLQSYNFKGLRVRQRFDLGYFSILQRSSLVCISIYVRNFAQWNVLALSQMLEYYRDTFRHMVLLSYACHTSEGNHRIVGRLRKLDWVLVSLFMHNLVG